MTCHLTSSCARRNSVWAILSLLIAVPAGAQQVRVQGESLRFRDLDGRLLRTAEYDVRVADNLSSSRRDWFRVRGEYESAPSWLDDVRFVCYALFRPDWADAGVESPTSRYLLFRGEQAHYNVREGRHVVDFYIHPATLERYGAVQRVALVMSHQGRTVGALSEPDAPDGWWDQLPAVDEQVFARTETPFALVAVDAHEMIRPGSTEHSRR